MFLRRNASALMLLTSTILFNPYLIKAQTKLPYNAQHPLPSETQFTMTGVAIPKESTESKPIIASSNSMKAMVLHANTSPGPFGLPRLEAKGYDETAITNALNDLFDNWAPARNQYAAYFVMMPWKFDIKAEAGPLTGTTDKLYLLQHYKLNSSQAGITLEIPSAINKAAAFADPTDSIFVKLDGYPSFVPIPVARLIQTDFVNGFVTRLVLDAYIQAAKLPGHGAYGTLGSMDASLKSTFKGDPAVFTTFLDPATWAGADFGADVSAVLINHPITSTGMLLGWSAADNLLKDDDANHRYQKDVWTLLSYRYTFRSFGAMAAFTLNYLNGVTLNDRVLAIIKSQTVPPSTAQVADIVKYAAADPGIVQAKQFLVSFGNVLDAEFYAITQNKTLTSDQRLLLSAESFDLMEGYRRGLTKAADVIYRETASLDFGLGYSEGFRDGYTLGYANGWKDGYAQGNKDAWAAANQVIAGLQQQIASLQSQLSKANSSSGSSFWDNLGSIADTVGTVVGIIGSVF